MRKPSVENIVALLIVLAIAFLIIALLLLSGISKYQQASARAYDMRRRADAIYAESVMRSRHADSTRWGTFIVYGPNDDDWKFEPSDGSPEVTPVVVEMSAVHRQAVDLVNESIKQLGKDSSKLLPANKRPSADQWQSSVDYLKGMGLVIATNGGTLVKNGTLQDVMTKLAVSSLPRRPA